MTQAPSRTTVMLVDDTPANLRLLSKILEEVGYEVRALPSGELAIDSARNDPPELILLDVRMPNMNGYQVCAELKKEPRTREIPVIFISALQETEDKLLAFQAGGVDYITKPFEQAEVLARVNTHLELAQTRAALVEERKRAESANRAKSAFLANMSHELRTPLNAVLGYAQLLANDESLPSHVLTAVQTIHQGGEYLLTLINEVLDLAKVEAGRFEIHPEPFHPSEFFPDIVAMFQIRAEQKGIGFVYQEPQALPFILIGDSKRLRQVVMNLLGNAIKFTPHGEVRLEVAYRDGQLHIAVVDSGIGIEAGQIETIFQPFGQSGDNEYKSQGTGLGLAISRNLVELMGGAIEVQSTLGHGSRFLVTLPMPQKVGDADAPPPRHRPDYKVTGYRRSDGQHAPYQVLVVDDKEDNRRLLIDLLGPLGFGVSSVGSGEAGLERLAQGGIDLLITDLALPGINGLETMRRGHTLPGCAGMPMIVLSGSSFPVDRAASHAAGAKAHLDKPLDQYQLFDTLAELLALEWQTKALRSSEDDVAGTAPLPSEWVAELTELDHRGLLTRMVDRLEAMLAEHPGHPTLTALYEEARNFNIARLRKLLQQLGA